MKLLSNKNNILFECFSELCERYAHYKWAVAWAGDIHQFDGTKTLSKHEDRIDKIVVGLHFYQTSPSFIERYMSNAKVHFYMQSDGTFHSKIYLFYNNPKDWSAIIGSSNFTQHGFHKNMETNILISNEDCDDTFYDELAKQIEEVWKEGRQFTKSELKSYKEAFGYQQKNHKSLQKFSSGTSKVNVASLDVMTWSDYLRYITTQDVHNCDYRIDVLTKAQKVFSKYSHFNDIPLSTRKAIAGFASSTTEFPNMEADWKFFGSMQGAGTFKHAIIAEKKIGDALDKIPLRGPVTKKQFEEYCKAFSGWNDPLACITRLLAMKRPDLFICINSKNKYELSHLLNIPQSHFRLLNYWDEILMRIHDSVWFQDNSKTEPGFETQVKQFQVAMLDSISYRN